MKLPVVAYLDFASNVLPLGMSLYRWSRLTRSMHLFFGFLVLGIITEMTSYFLASRNIPTLGVLQVYHLIGYLFLLFILSQWILGRPFRRIIQVSMAVYAIMWMITKFSVEPLSGLDWYTFPAVSVVIIAMCVGVLFSVVRDGTTDYLSQGVFWFAGGVFLYFISNLLYFSLLGDFVTLDRETAIWIWSMHWAVNVAVNLIYTWGFWVAGRPR